MEADTLSKIRSCGCKGIQSKACAEPRHVESLRPTKACPGATESDFVSLTPGDPETPLYADLADSSTRYRTVSSLSRTTCTIVPPRSLNIRKSSRFASLSTTPPPHAMTKSFGWSSRIFLRIFVSASLNADHPCELTKFEIGPCSFENAASRSTNARRSDVAAINPSVVFPTPPIVRERGEESLR